MTAERVLYFETMVRKARARLNLNDTDTMARRGVFLVDALLHESPRGELNANPMEKHAGRPEFYHILERFMQRDQPLSLTNHSGGSNESFGGDVQGFEDFDIWYHQTFG